MSLISRFLYPFLCSSKILAFFRRPRRINYQNTSFGSFNIDWEKGSPWNWSYAQWAATNLYNIPKVVDQSIISKCLVVPKHTPSAALSSASSTVVSSGTSDHRVSGEGSPTGAATNNHIPDPPVILNNNASIIFYLNHVSACSTSQVQQSLKEKLAIDCPVLTPTPDSSLRIVIPPKPLFVSRFASPLRMTSWTMLKIN